jgi:PKD repeat protein
MKRLLIAGLLAVVTAGCGDLEPENRPFDVAVVADRTTAQVGATVNFQINARGNAVIRVDIDFGDGATDVLDARGAQTVITSRSHAYTAPGVYTVTASAEDVAAGKKAATLPLTIE